MINIHFRDKTNTWPAFVDLFSNLVIILIFLLIVFVFLWTTTSVFNKATGVKTIAELKQTNVEQSEQIQRMQADAEEATRLLVQARSNLESAAEELEAKDSSIVDLIGAYETQVNQLQSEDSAKKQKIEELTAELQKVLDEQKRQLAEFESQTQAAQAQFAEQLAAQQAQMAAQQQAQQSQLAAQQSQMAEYNEKYRAELEKLNAALNAAEEKSKQQEVKYVEMSTRLNKALADKIAELQDMSKYQSEFYKSIKLALGDQASIQQDGDRFIVPSDILFSSGSYKLSAEGKNQLKLISNVIKDFETKIPTDIDWIIRVDGHTDKKQVVRGNRAYKNNTELSLLRATAVVNELVRDGVSIRRLVPSGFGESYPVELGDAKDALQKNRRIELRLTNK